MTDDLFPPVSIARRVDRELFVLLGGTAALLLQIAHPLVAAGVAQHSDFRRDPLGRLRRTLDTTLAVVFGSPDDARRALRRIDARHAGVSGVAGDGRTYRARDPRLLLWVEATLILTSLRLYDLVLGPLGPREREAYWAESRPIAAALGIPEADLPRTLADLAAFERDMLASEVVPDATSRELAVAVRRPSRLIPAPLLWPTDALTAGLLPPSIREAFGLRWRRRERLLFRAVIVVIRALRRAIPERLAIVPQARRWEDRRAR